MWLTEGVQVERAPSCDQKHEKELQKMNHWEMEGIGDENRE